MENETSRIQGNTLAPFMAGLFNSFIKEGFTPKQWQQTEVILLYKKGYRSDLNNCRPISISSNIGKIFG